MAMRDVALGLVACAFRRAKKFNLKMRHSYVVRQVLTWALCEVIKTTLV